MTTSAQPAQDRFHRESTGVRYPFVQLNIRTITEDLRNKFKAWCAIRNITMNDAIAMLIKRAVLDDKTESELVECVKAAHKELAQLGGDPALLKRLRRAMVLATDWE